MTNKVQKIRKEVARLKLCTMDEHMKFYSECAEAEYNALCKVEEIIDSLQEEPKSKFVESIQEGDNIVYNEDLGCRVNLSLLDRVAKKEKPVSKDLRTAANVYVYENAREEWSDCDMHNAFIEGAKWQKQQMMANAVDVTIAVPYQNSEGGYTQLVDSKKGLPFGDNLKVLIIKED